MDFKVLAEQYRSELFDSVLPFWLKRLSKIRSMEVIFPASIEMVAFTIQISSFGYKGGKYGCFLCFTIK